MLDKDIISLMQEWAYPLGNFWNDTQTIELYFEGLSALNAANAILKNVPADVGGTISSSLTRDEIETVNENRLAMKNFVDGIHYEIAELVDVPFARRMEPIVEGLYALNPEDIATDYSFADVFPSGTSLQELMLGIVDDPLLSQNLQQQFGRMNSDVMSENLQNTFATAQFWATEFENAHAVGELTQEFMEEHKENWNSYTPEQKKKLLEQFATQVAIAMGATTVPIKISFEDLGDNLWGQAPSEGGTVLLNSNFLTEGNANFSFETLINITVHETRHSYQYDVYDDPEHYGASPEILGRMNPEEYIPSKDSFKDYYKQSMETDARAFAGLAMV